MGPSAPAVTKRLLLLMSTETYRATDFLAAARKMNVEVVTGLDQPDPLGGIEGHRSLCLDFLAREESTREILRFHDNHPLDAVVSVDDSATVLAARACKTIGLPGNTEEATIASVNKFVFREIMQASGLRSPWFDRYPMDSDPMEVARGVTYPCVLKPLFLNASRGVIRANHEIEFAAAFRRIVDLLKDPGLRARGGEAADWIMVESFMPGREVALEGMMGDEKFQLLAFYDKPDPLDGPYFEETIFVTPSRLSPVVQQRAVDTVSMGAAALGLQTGPVHAELRIDDGKPYLLELATRSIGGHCSRTLRFGVDMSLEELILRQALGMPNSSLERESGAAGVMMIPIPGKGILHAVHGLDDARGVDGIRDVEISIPVSQQVLPLPEAHRYLGFIFSQGKTPEEAERRLRESHAHLRFDIR